MISSQITAIPKSFIGMDVHKKSWTCHFKTDLFDFKTVTMPADPSCLHHYVEQHFSAFATGRLHNMRGDMAFGQDHNLQSRQLPFLKLRFDAGSFPLRDDYK